MNRAERIFLLHRLLRDKRPIPLRRLIAELGMARATIKRDIEYMRDFMHAPIVYERAANGYRYDPDAPAFELPGLWFNQSELHALLACEQLLEQVQPGLLAPYIGPLRTRIRSLLEQGGTSATAVTSRVLLRTAARRSVDPECFGTVAGAVLDGRQLSIDYTGRARNQASTRRVHPLRLMHYRDNWYLVAWCGAAAGLRTFSLDCITVARALDQAARSVDDAALDRHLGASFGIFTGEACAWAVLRFNRHAARWVADETWHPDQIGQWRDGGYELQVPYSDPRELVMDILKYGPDVEVIAPEGLRADVVQRLRDAAARYCDDVQLGSN